MHSFRLFSLATSFVLFIVHIRVEAQGTIPTFQHAVGSAAYTIAGHHPSSGSTTTIRTVLVPISLRFPNTGGNAQSGKTLDARADAPAVLKSPVFSSFNFGTTGRTQYGDAMLRSTFVAPPNWHTLLARPSVEPITVDVPVGAGYLLSSKRTGSYVGVVDVQFLQRALFRKLSGTKNALVIAFTHNTTFYADGDATVCCSGGTHGVDAGSGTSFLLGSFFRAAPVLVEANDIQLLTEQLAEFLLDPLHDPLSEERNGPGNHFPSWLRPTTMRPGDGGRCGGTGVASRYFLLEPTDTNPKNNFPASMPFVVQGTGQAYHVQNVALLPWYTGATRDFRQQYSFPDSRVLPDAADGCPTPGRNSGDDSESNQPALAAAPRHAAIALGASRSSHQLIGYWEGYRQRGGVLPLRELSRQWDVVIVAFAVPDQNAPEGTMRFEPPSGMTEGQLRADIAFLKQQGRKVLISLGGGGQHFTLADSRRVPNYVSSVTRIVERYGFDGIDIDFESPSLAIAPGDDDFRHPTTPSIVNLISALRQLQDHFGSGFAISLVPEGTQIPAGYPSYGGQFGSYLAITSAIRDILTFIDVQDYNTPPLQGLDGEIYQAGSPDYHAAMTELLLHGFPVGGRPDRFFPPLPANKVAVGFLTGDAQPVTLVDSLRYLMTGVAPRGSRYRLRNSQGYPDLLGAMFWTIDADQRHGFNFSNLIGPLLHDESNGR